MVQLTEVEYDPFASPELARAVPTTHAQREIWLAVQLGPEASLAYNESVTLRFEGGLDVAALRNALLALADRHDALRATFSGDGSSMLIAARGALQLEVVDTAGDLRRLEALRVAAVETPFDLVAGPLVRALLARTDDATHELLLTAHHIVCDGWSFGVLARELMALYDAMLAPREPLPPADSYGDHALAQHDAEHVAAAEADLRHWVARFEDGAPALELPTDRPRGALRGFASRREDLQLPAPLVRAVRALGAQRGASLFATLYGVYAGLIARLARSDDVVIGLSAAAQAAEGRQTLVGHCVNLLPVRLAVDLELPLSALVQHTRSAVLTAYEHQSCSFGRLLERLKLGRDASRLPLVSVLFNLDAEVPAAALSRPGLQVSLRSNPRRYENFDLYLNASENAEGVLLEVQYQTALFEADTVRRWLVSYRQALERWAAAPDIVAADAYSASQADREQLAAYNATAQPYEAGLRLSDLLLRGLRRDPQATALRFEGRSVSHAELEAWAWGVCARLREAGAGPGVRVGVCLNRGVEMVVALAGCVLSGAAYVPLDPSLPAPRLAQMVEDAGLGLVLTRTTEAAVLGGAARPILLDALDTAAPQALAGTPDDVAYVIFTSGSTGRPKGAMNAHRGIVNRLQWMQQAYALTPADRVMQKTPFGFDVSVWEFFWPLMEGATLVIARPEGHRDGAYLVELICRESVSLMHFVPSMLRLFLAEPDAAACRTLRRVVCSGEALPYDVVERFFATLPGVALANLYGPTEAAVDVSAWECRPGDAAAGVPIGAPIANTTLHVLDERRRLLPLGVPGELYIGGVQVGLGYVARPELSAERFVDDPALPGGRLYKTGDVARWRADGNLDYLGRADFQVKLRGYRIELGEIEARLAQHPAVAACVVATHADAGDVRLVAYVVARPAQAVDAAALREFARATLPDYMVPQHVVSLPALPLLSNGKINRRALPAPQAAARDAAAPRVAPRTPLEGQVLEVFEQVLKLPGLSVDDDFFALGGHSLLAAQATARLNKALDANLALALVFRAPTAAALAAAIDAGQRASAPRRAPVVAGADQSAGPLTVMQERIRFVEQLYPGRVVYNTPSAHRLRGPLDRAAFERALAAMVQRQPSLRTWIDASGPTPLQRVAPALALALPFEDLSAVPPAEREATLMQRLTERVNQPLDIHRAPLFRVALWRLADDEHVFLFMPHHIIWDGWSFDLLYQELAAEPGTLPPLPVSYLDYARWHAQWLAGDECRAQVDYWKRRLARLPLPRNLATDRPRHAGMSGAGAVEWVQVDKALTEQLRGVARDAGATLNMLTLAVYAALMTQALGSTSLVIGVPVRGRLAAEVEPVMGFFNNLLPACLELDPALALPAWIGRVKAELLELLAHQDVPFERLAEEPELAARAHGGALYQTLFSFQDARERPRRWGALEQSSVLVMQHGATEDFGLWLMEVPGGLEGGVNYNADLFDAATAALFRDRYVALLRRVAQAPAATVADWLDAPGADRGAMRAWVAAHAAPAAAAEPAPPVAAALAPAELALAEIWAELLGIEATQILAQDLFFDLGGNSLLAMRAIAEGERRLGLRIEPRRYVFEPLRRLAQPVAEPALATAAPAATAPDVKSEGLLGRLFGRRPRR